jgi:hypothetical protein
MRPLLLLLCLAGCQEPFGTDRHDLVGVRIAALTVEHAQDGMAMHAAVVLDGNTWADDRPQLSWHQVSDDAASEVAALAHEGAIATGPSPVLDLQAGDYVALVLTHGDVTRRALVELPEASGVPLTGVSITSSPYTVQDVTAEQMELEERRSLAPGEAVDSVEPGGFVRLALVHEQTSDVPRARWMLTAPGGTFYELQRTTTDWSAGSVVVDDDEVEERTIDESGPRTVVVLATDHELSNAWVARDFFVGEAGAGMFTSSGRWIAGDLPDAPFVSLVLAADDGSPSGLGAVDAMAVEPGDGADPYGTESLDCGGLTVGPFDPTWLLELRCTRSEVVGKRVVVRR